MKSYVQKEIGETYKRLDHFVSDLIITPSEEPSAKKQKTDGSNMAASSSAEKVTESADNADSGNSKDVASNSAKDVLQEKVGETTPPSWIARLADKFTPADKIGPPISAGLADLLKTVIRDRGSKKDEDKNGTRFWRKIYAPKTATFLLHPK